MEVKNRKDINVLLIMGDASYATSTLRVLNSKYSNVAWIMPGALSRRMICRFYTKGNKVWEASLSHIFLRNKLFYWLFFPMSIVIQLLFTPTLLGILLSQKTKIRFDLCIAEFYSGTLCALFLRKIGLVRKVVYYVTDWFPYQPSSKTRFATSIANNVFFPYLDRFCARRADATWNLTQRIIDGRHNRWKNNPFIIAIEEVIPPTLTWRRIMDEEDASAKHKSIAFFGVLKKGKGLELAIEAIADLKKQGKYLTLHIIGTSPQEVCYREYVKKLDVDDRIIFHGFVEDETEVMKILQSCICGLALYEVGKENYTYYTWPSKVGFYIECGLPVIITRSATIADDVEKEKLGIVVDLDLKSISDAIYTLVTDENLLKECKANINNFVQSRSSGNDVNNAIFRVL